MNRTLTGSAGLSPRAARRRNDWSPRIAEPRDACCGIKREQKGFLMALRRNCLSSRRGRRVPADRPSARTLSSRLRIWRCIAVVAALVLLPVPSAFAQRDIEIQPGLQFDFINPGARSLAMGGAFIGLADDATAASTNPAG